MESLAELLRRPAVSWTDVLDIALVSFLIYELLLLIRGTRAVQMALSGGFLEPGPARLWLRQRCALVEGEAPSALQRTLVIADVGNGISAVLDPMSHLFINVDLTVHLERMPEGEWVLVDAVTRPRPNGVGSAESELSDREGRIGRALQTLLFAAR